MAVDILIIGGGIAGLTAAIYARRAGKSVTVIESKVYGGQIITSDRVDNYPGEQAISGVDLMNKIQKQAEDLGAKLEFDEIEELEKIGKCFKAVGSETYKAKAVIIATGTDFRKLDLPNEEMLTGRGISYCATCDGNFFKGKPVAVYGGGNTAIYEALYLSKLASEVFVIHRRSDFRASQALVDELESRENVTLVLEDTIAELLHDKKLTGLKLSSGRELDADALFVAIGRTPNVSFCGELEKDENGYIVAGEDCQTSIEGIFVAGDARTKKLRQLVTAASDGAIAAEAAIKYLND